MEDKSNLTKVNREDLEDLAEDIEEAEMEDFEVEEEAEEEEAEIQVIEEEMIINKF